jgi:hypothetical protein
LRAVSVDGTMAHKALTGGAPPLPRTGATDAMQTCADVD